MSATDDVAFVVIGRNEGERLTACLASVVGAGSKLVYADSASSDGSVERARAVGAVVVELDPSMPLNAARGRHEGFLAARERFPDCRYVQFLDGDCILEPSWVRTALTFLDAHPKAAIACGQRFEAKPNDTFYNRLADEEWNTRVGPADACGGDAMMRVTAYEEVGGFNMGLMASEEPELGARMRDLGWEIWRLDARMTEHDAAIFQFSQWWRRTTRTGYGYAQAWRSTRHLAEPVNQARLRSALIWVVVLPLLTLVLALVSRSPALLLLLPFAWVAQIARIGMRRPDRSVFGWRSSAMTMVAKIPELIGAAQALLTSRQSQMIEYKVQSADPRRAG